MNVIALGTLGGMATALATFIGALPVLFANPASERYSNAMLGFAAGVMISASYLSLIVPAADIAQANGHGSGFAAFIVALAVVAGAATLDLLRRWDPVAAPAIGNGTASAERRRRVWLLLLAMTAHNFPEGAAVGVSFGSGDLKIGLGTTIGIGIQNLPEGLAVAASLLTVGTRRWTAVLIGGATGLAEPVGALVGVTLVSAVEGLLPAGMGWAAGAMLYICASELIPAVHRDKGDAGLAIWSTMGGIVLMLLLDIGLG
ncbi:ZIP family metal transporter [Altericroceibacterium xinjiangense]|uniref:ZIP family metal transporter n=1 Tax=Altericroceibacterium xinjiangense TaxID=762261 RepID=UPI000F7E0B9D|nr:ZIP family metal transporter [Altericroceibacterium xinjiangense]